MNQNILVFISILFLLVASCGKTMSPEEFEKLKKEGIEKARQGEYGRAIETLEKASSARPEDAGIYPYLAESYEKLGLDEKATETWQKFIFISPRNSPAAQEGLAKLKELELRKKTQAEKAD
jgi:Flp pilus assembly protein TadD